MDEHKVIKPLAFADFPCIQRKICLPRECLAGGGGGGGGGGGLIFLLSQVPCISC